MNRDQIKVVKFMVAAAFVVSLLAGCSASSALTGLIGSKPDVTAQAGAENTKQTVGINGKVDQSSESETSIKDSNVGKVDSSNQKKVSASSISANSIKADKIEIRNSDSDTWSLTALAACIALVTGVLIGARYGVSRNNKGA